MESLGSNFLNLLSGNMDIERINRWNRFIEDICFKNLDDLNKIQRMAVLCFWYDSEMNSGGFSGYKDCYPDTDPEELRNALMQVGTQDIADNYLEASTIGEDDGWEKTDKEYYDLTPSLVDCLQEFVEKNKNEIF